MALSTDLRQQFDAVDGGGNTHPLARRFLHAYHRAFAERPPAGAQSHAGGKHDDQFQLRARFHARLGIEKNSRRTEIASQARVLTAVVTHLDRDTNWHPLARTPLVIDRRSLLGHMLWKCTPVYGERGRWDDSIG